MLKIDYQNPKCGTRIWHSKVNAVIFVPTEEDKEKLFKILQEQDDFWVEQYKELIHIHPGGEISKDDVILLAKYCGRTDIYEIELIKETVPFVFYQYKEILVENWL